MNILITGGTGFIGSALCSRLLSAEHHIVILTRKPEAIKAPLNGIRDLSQLTDEAAFDVVINLAGEPIADKRWSLQQKQKITSSRVDITNRLIEYFKRIETKPALFISGSAIGVYGVGVADGVVDENASGDNSFSSQLCQQWEGVALQAQALGIRTCLLRAGIVLGNGGGALKKMLTPFKLGLGGRIGHAKQWMPWIHLNDLVGIILYCITHDKLQGAINGTAPHPVTNDVFTKTLGQVLKRITVFTLPGFMITLLMGEMGEELLLSGKRVMPTKILQAGYKFEFEYLDAALRDIV